MPQTQPFHPVADHEPMPRLPRRDYFLLPAIFIATILVILIGGEVTARWLYVQDADAEPCEYLTVSGFRYHPLCTSHTKVWDGPWITQQFNECGYRSGTSCAPRPPGSLRVVVVGSSTARGALVDYPDSFAGLASAELSRRCGGLVDFQNLGSEPPDVNRTDQRIPEVLGLQPAAIVMLLGSFDLVHLSDPPPMPGQMVPPRPFNLRAVTRHLRESRLFEVMQYYLYLDPSFQVRAFLLNSDIADFVRTPLSPAWQQRISAFGDLLARITARTGAIPVYVFYIPERAQVALAGPVTDPAGVDPFILGVALDKVAQQHGVHFTDTTRALAAAPDFQSLFYSTEGHAKAGGHAAIATVVERALLSAPAFARCLAR